MARVAKWGFENAETKSPAIAYAVFVVTVTLLFSGRTVSAEASLKQMMRDCLLLEEFLERTQRRATSSFFRIMVQRSALGTYWHSVVCKGRSSVPTALAQEIRCSYLIRAATEGYSFAFLKRPLACRCCRLFLPMRALMLGSGRKEGLSTS